MVRYTIYILTLVSYSVLSWGSFALAKDRIDANIQPLFDACIARCDRTDVLGNLTREGCVKSCEQIRRTFPLTGKKYSSYSSCLEETKDIELNRDLLIEEYQEWCDKTYDHIHKKKGCKDAVEVYINAISYENLCIRGGTTSAKRGTPSTTIAPVPIQASPIEQPAIKKQAVTPKAVATPRAITKTSPSITVAPTKGSSSIAKKTPSPLPQAKRSSLSSPSMKPLFASKQETPQSQLLNEHQGSSPSKTVKKNMLSNTRSINSQERVNNSSSTTLNNKKNSIHTTTLNAPTVSTKNAMPSSANVKKEPSSQNIQQKISSQIETNTQITQSEDKKISSQKALTDKAQSSDSQKITTTKTTLVNQAEKAKQTITSPIAQRSVATQEQKVVSASSQSPVVANTSTRGVVPTEEKIKPQMQVSSESVAVSADSKKSREQEKIASLPEPAKKSNTVITTTASVIESKPERSPELEKLINDVHVEMENSEKGTRSSTREQVTIAPTLPSATLSSPIASLESLSIGTPNNSASQQKTNATTRVQEEKNDLVQPTQTQIDPSIQLTRTQRQAPQAPLQPYGLSLPASAVKAPPPPMP